MDLVDLIYDLTGNFPKEELYVLTSQMRRAAISIPSNIAEGRRMGSAKGFIQFLRIALGSGCELETQIEICYRRKYIERRRYDEVSSLLVEVLKMLNKMVSNLKTTT